MISIEKIVKYIIPMYGNKRTLPYGDLLVADGSERKIVKIQDDNAGQYFSFGRKKHYIRNCGSLYNPKFVIVGSFEI